MNQLESRQLVEVKAIDKLSLYRWREANITFEELLLMRVLSGHPVHFRIYELGMERCSLGYLPLVLVNDDQVVLRDRLVTLVQSFCSQPNQSTFLTQKAVLHACQQLMDVQRLGDIQDSSRYWLLLSPFKKLREYLYYKKQVERLKTQGISQKSDNIELFTKRLLHFESLLTVDDQFSRLVLDSCLDFFWYRDSEIASILKSRELVKKYRKQRHSERGREPGKPLLDSQLYFVSPKPPKAEEKKQKAEPNPEGIWSGSAKQAVAKAALVTAAVWLPMFIFKLAGERES